MKKRYPDNKVYNDFYCKFQVESSILNSGSETIPSAYTILWDKQNLEAELRRIVGDKKGLYAQGRESYIAFIPSVEMRLQEIADGFKGYCRQKINQGHEKPTEWPKELLTEKLQNEARLDVLQGEKEKIEKRLKQLNDVVTKVDDSKVLQFGLICSGSFHSIGTPRYAPERAKAELDGQYLTMVPEGFLIIDDPRSPYHLMKVSDYHRVAKQWVKDRMQADKEKLLIMQAKAKENYEPLPQSTGLNLSGKIDKKDLPKWPDWAIKYEPEKSITDDKIKRTKYVHHKI